MMRVHVLWGWLVLALGIADPLSAQPTLGDAPRPPTDVSGLPGRGARPLLVTGDLNVDTTSREQVREFYNAVYLASTGVPIASSAVTDQCLPGTNSPAFNDATLLRINWYRAMAGLASSVTFDAGESTKDQAAAVMMAQHGALQHVGVWTNWDCFTTAATNASANSNLALGSDGPDAITQYMLDYGVNNFEVGHRRYILYPQTQIMGTGDVPPEGTHYAANATWVFDANYFGPRPATRAPYVAWPPSGYVPWQVVFPQWSFALSNANLSAASVTMTSNGVPMAVTVQTYLTGYGENTLVWHPTGLDPTVGTTTFPFSGVDTVYAIAVSNVLTANQTNSFSYSVTVFDPATPGPDYFPLTISGTNQPAWLVGNHYTCTPAANPHTTGYQWQTAQATNGYLVDNAVNGTSNFLVSLVPVYPIITNAPAGGGKCFHLAHPGSGPQILELSAVFFPSNNAAISFKSLLGYSTTNEIARVQVAVNGGSNWVDLYTQAGKNSPGESAFTLHTLSLSNYAGKAVRLRFNYDFSTGILYSQIDPVVGWCLENIVVTNTQRLFNFSTSTTLSTNFTFTPLQTGDYVLAAQGLIFNEFPLDWGTAREVTSVVGPPVIKLDPPAITGNQVKIKFALSSGVATNFHLLQANQVNGAWTTNGTAALTTNVPGSNYQFTTTNGPAARFYRVQTP